MKITVLGAGLLGVSTAYFLAARQHEVEVIERQPSPGMETSFSTGCQLSFSHAEPWATPSVLPKVLKWMFRKDAPLVFHLRPDPQMVRWGIAFLRNCTRVKAEISTANILRLGIYNKTKMEQLLSLHGIQFHHLKEGILHIFSREGDLTHALEQMRYQEKLGCPFTPLDTEGCMLQEPALRHTERKIIGGIHLPLDESGDGLEFTRELAKICQKELGVTFHYGVTVKQFKQDKGNITGVRTNIGDFTADAYVMALGSYSPLLLRQVGIDIPVYPMKGYSITLPANQYSPAMSVTDNEYKVVYSRVGQKVRVAGTAEFAGYDTSIPRHRVEPLERVTRSLFPKSPREVESRWACLRPSTPDGPPIIGKTKYPNLFLNTGHGTLGWTQCIGSAALLADIMEDRPTEISLEGLTLDRF